MQSQDHLFPIEKSAENRILDIKSLYNKSILEFIKTDCWGVASYEQNEESAFRS